jgi:hypothetical protein
MPLLTALSAGRTAFQLIPKDKEARKKAAEKISKGFKWVTAGLSKIKSVNKTKTGYTVTSGDDEETKSFSFGGFGKPSTPDETNDLMKYAPYLIGGILLLSMKR